MFPVCLIQPLTYMLYAVVWALVCYWLCTPGESCRIKVISEVDRHRLAYSERPHHRRELRRYRRVC